MITKRLLRVVVGPLTWTVLLHAGLIIITMTVTITVTVSITIMTMTTITINQKKIKDLYSASILMFKGTLQKRKK